MNIGKNNERKWETWIDKTVEAERWVVSKVEKPALRTLGPEGLCLLDHDIGADYGKSGVHNTAAMYDIAEILWLAFVVQNDFPLLWNRIFGNFQIFK